MLGVDVSRDLITSDVLLVLQLRTGNDPLFPKLGTFECEGATEAFIPLAPSFLSPKTTPTRIKFAVESLDPMIVRSPTSCPHIKWLCLYPLPRNPVIVEAVSEMLISRNQNTPRARGTQGSLQTLKLNPSVGGCEGADTVTHGDTSRPYLTFCRIWPGERRSGN